MTGVVAVVHGYGDHGGRYTWLGEDLAARGWALYAYDLRGHGQSSGRRGQVRRFDEYLDDTEVFLDEVRRAQPGKPVFLLGHSMGGLVCARLAEVRPPDVTGLILSSPFLQLVEAVPPSRVAGVKVLAKVWPNRDIGNTVRAAQLSHEESVVEAYVTDPLVHHVAPARWAVALLGAQDAAMAESGRIALPLLVLYGTEDEVVDFAFIEALYAQAASADKSSPAVRGLLPRVLQRDGPRAGLRRPRGLARRAAPRRRLSRRARRAGTSAASPLDSPGRAPGQPPGGRPTVLMYTTGSTSGSTPRIAAASSSKKAAIWQLPSPSAVAASATFAGDVPGVEQHVAGEALAVLPARALQHRGPDEHRLRVGAHALAQRGVGERHAQVGDDEALERAAEHVVVVQAALQLLDVVGHHVVLDGVEAAGGGSGAEGEAVPPLRDPGGRPQQGRELAEGERPRPVRSQAPAPCERVEQPAVVQRQVW